MNDNPQIFGEFSGVARLFPLPNLVLFPHVVQPLHIFEARYRQMTEDALAGDRFIAMVLLKPGWEPEYDARPEIHDIGCLGHVMSEQKLADGKYNLLLRGLCRFRVGDEIPDKRLYRSARGDLLPDSRQDDLPKLRQNLQKESVAWLPRQEAFLRQFRALLDKNPPLGTLCDILAFTLPLPVEIKQELLEELDVEERARRLVYELKNSRPPEKLHEPRAAGYPPDFSVN